MEDPNYNIFTDTRSIHLGDTWRNITEGSISECDVFVVIVTRSSIRSDEVEKEVIQARRERKKIIPCIYHSLKKDQIKWGLADLQGIIFEDGYDLGRKIYEKIVEEPQDQIETEKVERDQESVDIPQYAVSQDQKKITYKLGSRAPEDPNPWSKVEPGAWIFGPDEVGRSTPFADMIGMSAGQKSRGMVRFGDILRSEKKLQQAIRSYDVAIEHDPKNVDAWIKKGHALEKLGRLSEAKICWDKAREVSPSPLIHDQNGRPVELE